MSMTSEHVAKKPRGIVGKMTSWCLLLTLLLLHVGCERSVPALQLVAFKTMHLYPHDTRIELYAVAGRVGFVLFVPPDRQVSANVHDARFPSPDEFRGVMALAQGFDFHQHDKPAGNPKGRVTVTQEWSDGRITTVSFKDDDPQFKFYEQWRRAVSNVMAGRPFDSIPPKDGTDSSFELK